jgi:hypothetical protein
MTDCLTFQEVQRYAIANSRALLLSDEGKKAGYWEKPLLRKPRVSGSALILGTYGSFITGCAFAGLVEASDEQAPILPDAESLVGYYLNYPRNKAILDAHFRDSDEYAARKLPPEAFEALRAAGLTDSRTVLSRLTAPSESAPTAEIDAPPTLSAFSARLSPARRL